MIPYNYPQLRVATIEGLPETAVVTWEFAFDPESEESKIEVVEKGHHALVFISDEVEGTLTLTPTVTGADEEVDTSPLTLEFKKPRLKWAYSSSGSLDEETAVVTLGIQSFRVIRKDYGDLSDPFEWWASCGDSRVCIETIFNPTSEIVINLDWSSNHHNLFNINVLGEYKKIIRDSNSLRIINPTNIIYLTYFSELPCQDGYMNLIITGVGTNGSNFVARNLGVPLDGTFWVANMEDFAKCDYTLEFLLEHTDAVNSFPGIIPKFVIKDDSLIVIAEQIPCMPLFSSLSPGVIEITPVLVPKIQGLDSIELDPIYMVLTLGGCSAPESSS